uniref:Uncharacterized protein n=1 Tax=Lepeophtheirus salmonis TaxID=72036 RepID=A0A0K2SW99_LEPSM
MRIFLMHPLNMFLHLVTPYTFMATMNALVGFVPQMHRIQMSFKFVTPPKRRVAECTVIGFDLEMNRTGVS